MRTRFNDSRTGWLPQCSPRQLFPLYVHIARPWARAMALRAWRTVALSRLTENTRAASGLSGHCVGAVEAPLHFSDLAARVAGRWDCVLSSRRAARVRAVAEVCAREGQIVMRDDFIYPAGPPRPVTVRPRAGTKIPPERIPPEEYREAVLMVLRAGDGLDRIALTKAVRGLLGFGRTSPALEEAVRRAVDPLAAEEAVGEGSTGVRLRQDNG